MARIHEDRKRVIVPLCLAGVASGLSRFLSSTLFNRFLKGILKGFSTGSIRGLGSTQTPRFRWFRGFGVEGFVFRGSGSWGLELHVGSFEGFL